MQFAFALIPFRLVLFSSFFFLFCCCCGCCLLLLLFHVSSCLALICFSLCFTLLSDVFQRLALLARCIYIYYNIIDIFLFIDLSSTPE